MEFNSCKNQDIASLCSDVLGNDVQNLTAALILKFYTLIQKRLTLNNVVQSDLLFAFSRLEQVRARALLSRPAACPYLSCPDLRTAIFNSIKGVLSFHPPNAPLSQTTLRDG